MARGDRLRWTRDAKLKKLSQVQLFSECTKGELARIARLADELDVPAGDVLMRQGDFGHEFFVILAGKAKVSIRGDGQKTLGPGAWFGEMALLKPRGKRMATVTAETDMDLLVLGAREFSALIDELPSVGKKVLAAVAERLRRAERAHVAH